MNHLFANQVKERKLTTATQKLKNTAQFSTCRKYRYALWRIWDEAKPYVMFVCLNPSTADEQQDDPTVTRCIHYANRWGYGGVCMTNLFAYRATQPEIMESQEDPVGKDNDQWLVQLAREAGIVVAAWGNHGGHLQRSKQVVSLLPDLYYLKLNKSGEPAHPLYLSAQLTPLKWHREECDDFSIKGQTVF
ncbi:DUF1643 domain-containing protein [Celerinatantimonas sp. YJH-8]|uniref:DUF1643 domain-containing protein n=1 Tax=Celerinatantimonas sp. YJH-8 TaxID=3228714 RepID=UPI0038BF3D38